MIKALVVVFLAFLGQTARASCEAEENALASCEASASRCLVDSQCDADQQCVSRTCVDRPQPTRTFCSCDGPDSNNNYKYLLTLYNTLGNRIHVLYTYDTARDCEAATHTVAACLM